MRWLPNLLTLVRFPLAAWVAVSILRGSFGQALLLLAVAGLTDGLDGWAARRLGAVSRLGAALDPVADKALLVTVYLSLGAAGLIPVWLVWIVVGRDALILAFAGALLALHKARRFEPSVWGKLSTLVQIVTGAGVIAAQVFPSAMIGWWAELLPILTAVTTAWSGIHYAWLALPRQNPAGGGDHVPRD
ncbi:MAG TPA: CDP-alcohol phosphatidyltransferase family protein [Bryobacteraceae bacterium]|nr:CDP-alcohol phosphatidyltransferase family protein [Bryobacteraceae bacterium]